MKKSYLYLVFFFIILQNLAGQNKEIGRLDFNVGFQYINNIQLNEVLETKNLPEVNSLNNFVGFNIDVYLKKFIFSPEFGLIYSSSKKDDYRTDLSGLVGTIGLGYSLLKTSKVNVGLLGFVSAIPTEITLAYDKSTIDLRNLDPKVSTGLISLNYVPINLGINLRSTFFYDSTFPIGIGLSYEIGVNKPEIKSDYATILNTIKEKGDRISVKLIVPFKKY